MKLAEIRDIWRAVRRSNKRILRRIRVKWSGNLRLTDGAIEIVSPITLICGENGAGKSSLLHTIAHAVGADEGGADGVGYCRPRSETVEEVELDVATGDTANVTVVAGPDVHTHLFPSDGDLRFLFLDAGMHVPAMLDFIKSDANFSDLLEGIDPILLSDVELGLARFIVGRNYERIEIFEVSDSSFDGPLPYMRVHAQAVTYDTLDMGYGEIAAIYLLWALRRAANGALILIEEPETFLSPRAQTALVDVIARYVKDKGIFVIMTSHSGPIAARMLNQEIVYATRAAGRVTFHNPAKTSDLVARLGLVPDRSFIFFVEDQAAEIFARALLDNFSDRLSASVEYAICGGSGNTLRAIEVIPNGLQQVAHVALLDGDQRAVELGQERRVVFLPGDVAPESLLIQYARSKSHFELSQLMQISEADVSRAVAHADGDELHNFFHSIARTLAIPYREVLRRVVIAWAGENRGPVEEFVREAERISIGDR